MKNHGFMLIDPSKENRRFMSDLDWDCHEDAQTAGDSFAEAIAELTGIHYMVVVIHDKSAEVIEFLRARGEDTSWLDRLNTLTGRDECSQN